MLKFSQGLKFLNLKKENIETLMQACINTYRGKHGNIIKCLEKETILNVNTVDIIHGYMDDYFVIGFRGTNGDAEWINNFIFELVNDSVISEDKNVKVHLGFSSHFKFINLWLNNFIERNQFKKIIFTGHSLGATTASFSAEAIKKKFPDIEIKLVTFGSPKMGNKEYCNYHNNLIPQTLNIRNKNDIVTKVPFAKMKYKHTKEYTWIKKPKWYEKILHPISFFKGCKDDHRPKNYLKNIKEEKL